MTLFDTVLLPVADEDDAAATCDALDARIDEEIGTVIAVHIIEKAGGYMDKAPLEGRQEQAEEIFEVVTDRCEAANIPIETELRYGTDVVETIFEVADERDASVIVFTPRPGSRWASLLAGDTTHSLVDEASRPVLVLPSGPV